MFSGARAAVASWSLPQSRRSLLVCIALWSESLPFFEAVSIFIVIPFFLIAR